MKPLLLAAVLTGVGGVSAGLDRHTTPAAPAKQTAAKGSTSPTGVAQSKPTGSPADTVGASASAAASANAATPGTAKVENATATLKSVDASATLQSQIAKLPPLTGTNIDVAKGSAQLLAHLNAVLRFYRAAMVPIQKVGEPSDVLYAEQSESEATQIAELAFQGAKNEAGLLSKIPGADGKTAASKDDSGTTQQDQTQAQRLTAVRVNAQQRLSALQAQQTSLAQQIAKARGDQRASLLQQQQQVEGGIELQQAMVDALGRINTVSDAQAPTGLAADIERLQRSAPELLSKPVQTPAPPVLQSLSEARSAGVSSQAPVLFQLLSTLHTIDTQTAAIDELSKQVDDLRAPFVGVLRSTIAQGNALTQQSVNLQATATTNAEDLANTRKQFDTLTNTFQVLATATLPVSQETVLLDNARGTLSTWRATVETEYKDILRHLLLRVAFIAVALVVLALANKLLSRAAVKYIADLRRRRQLLIIRRFVIGFLSGLVLIFGFVTNFSSLATFAGFISAGIAVGLQSILLSVAAYFFIVGRYGVRVGDRITVAGVTGDVIEVGLVRFYMMELVGTGTELHSTGRVAVFANSVLFQTGTPIYKQMPGTEYAWHELTAKLTNNADVQATTQAILKTVGQVYGSYSAKIEAQHQQVEGWMGTALPTPKVESRLQLTDGTLQFAVLFPVELENAAAADQQIAEEMVKAMRSDEVLRAGVSDLPVIKAAVKV